MSSQFLRLLLVLASVGFLFVQGTIVGPENAPFADNFLSRRRLSESAVNEEYIGELRHDTERRRLADEDMALPLPTHMHALGQGSRHERVHSHSEFSRYSTPTASSAHGAQEESMLHNHGRRLDADRTSLPALLTPLYQGYGTHFSYVYIGTPPQRQSVIVDTGSHYTAFPCVGCSQCGQHTDNYWDPALSTSVDVKKCGADTCSFGQSYSEGSSWRAYKVVDQLYVGGIDTDTVPTGDQYKIPFMFGCQTSETGLFRTQLADGIMGMAMSIETLPSQLVEHKVAKSNIFAMCFRVGGGIMTLGGVDQRIHTKTGVQYAKIRETDGWYTIEVVDIMLTGSKDGHAKKSLGVDATKYNGGKGVIVDSGTTDTYLPISVAKDFQRIFKDITGTPFSSANQKLTEEQLEKMPDIVFVVKGTDGQNFDVVMPWSNYIDKVGPGTYAYRIYLTEGSGAVLGANFMNGYNVIFDKANRRVGFAKSDCVYDEYAEHEVVSVPTIAPTVYSGGAVTECAEQLHAVNECSARCNLDADEGHGYTKTGEQEYRDACSPASTHKKECKVSCNGSKLVRGVDTCPEKAWNPCLRACIQSRDMPQQDALAQNSCKYSQQTRSCYSGDCPMQDGDMLVFLDMRVGVSPSLWTYVYSEVFFATFAQIFHVPEQNIELLNDARSEYFLAAKLHFQIRLKSKDYASKKELVSAAQAIPVLCWTENFGDILINVLEEQSRRIDKLDYQRYAYLNEVDIEILNAVALPIGDVRDPIDVPLDEEDPNTPALVKTIKDAFKGKEEYFFVGVGLTVSFIMCCMFWLYLRLHRESLALAKEKLEHTSLMKMVNKLKGWQRGASDNVEFDEGHQYSEVQMGDLSGHGKGTHNPILSAHEDDEV